ncbi:Fructosamine kinase-domain-containing protein [Pseudomassariella vexata]|uniref:protein-ribulosamine 3-kinase n=1 Tax=Pseudomassariella vexata TaxID=1141098 RepID=A0A1Y2DR68_9PEZI|nr:Fructosamine kinase-domain-containing protein [Pseudomassariella vexata]ORY61679.1 Fructosamine kinase-domain-containing protein [Pseudomassariella vexata]
MEVALNTEAVLEEGDVIMGVNRYGTSTWAETSRIDAQTRDGSPRSYFLKDTLPGIAPRPRGYGEWQDRKGTYFFVCDYLNITHELPDPVQLGKKLAELHRKSQSPNGKFGFHCTTYDGEKPLNTTWDDSWTSFFKRLMNDVYQLEKKVNGLWQELDDVMQITLEHLIPRLLDPLTTEGRSIKPCLIHGDLWESNIGTDEFTDEIYIYDACAYYAHHEKEVGIWRCAHHQMTDKTYRDEYFKNYPPSEPRDEADDRNRLYSVETLIMNSLAFPGAKTRQLAFEELSYLINKYLKDGD